jgi:GntR family transcriptional regulator
MDADLATSPPLYAQLARLLVREIMAGRLADGQRLPPEREMAQEMGVAVGTLRRALAELERQGLLSRVQGSGNYIKATPEIAGVYAFFRLEKPGGGGVPDARLLDVSRHALPAEVAPDGWEGHRIRRLRTLDGVPAALEEIWLDAASAPNLDAGTLPAALYRMYREELGIWITHAEDRVSLGRVPDWALADFALPAGAPCGLVLRRSRDRDGRFVEYSRTWFDPGRAHYVQRLS